MDAVWGCAGCAGDGGGCGGGCGGRGRGGRESEEGALGDGGRRLAARLSSATLSHAPASCSSSITTTTTASRHIPRRRHIEVGRCTATMTVRPAHETKHIQELQYPFLASTFHLAQHDNGLANGTALWLGAQCLSLYLADICARKAANPSQTRPKLIELGSGIGLSAYVFPPSCSIFPPLHGVYSVLPSLSGSLSVL